MSKRKRHILALVLGCVMLAGCQIVVSNLPQEQDPGPQNQDSAADPVLKVRTLGMYDVDGEDYVYRRGEWQMSRNYSKDGKTVSFNLIDPSSSMVYSVSGIKPSASEAGYSIYVTFSARTPEKEIKTFSASAKVMGASGDTLWLKSSQGPYFVVKK